MAGHRQRNHSQDYFQDKSHGRDQPPKQLPKLRYRVRSWLSKGIYQTVWVTGDVAYAHWLADYFCSRVGVHQACVEQATRRGGQIIWQRVEPPKSADQFTFAQAPRLATGQVVIGQLLKQRTRRGGWLVEVWENGRPLTGHITNSAAVPQEAQAEQQVKIRLAAISNDRTHVQFRWCEESGFFPELD